MSTQLFIGGLLFDGDKAPMAGLGLLVEGGVIRRIAPVGEFDGHEGPRVDTSGQTLMPGLIDCHVHLCLGAEENVVGVLRDVAPGDLTLRILENAQAALRGGVTALRDLGGRDYLEMSVRDAIAAGRHLGPTLRCGGKVICMTGGHGRWIGIEADGEAEMVKAVRLNVREGADCIKLIATGGVLTPGVDPLASHLTEAEMAAAVAAAHRLGRRVAAHAQGAEGIRNAVAAGVDSIEHGFQLTDEIIEAMLARGTVLVPTLAAARHLVRGQDRLPPSVREKILRFSAMHVESFQRYVRAGGRVAMGTDAGTPLNPHGENAQELAVMAELGLPPIEALRAGTSYAADLLDLPRLGRLREGNPADLLLVEGDPVQDIARAADRTYHRAVYKNGIRVGPVPASAVKGGLGLRPVSSPGF